MKICVTVCALLLGCVLMAGCRPDLEQAGGGSSASQPEASTPENDPIAAAMAFADEEGEPGEKPFLEASRPFVMAIAARDYAKAYDALSSQAQRTMMPFQFIQGEGETENPAEMQPIDGMSKEKFVEWMGKVEEIYGPIEGVENIGVYELDPEVLSGKGVDRLFAIGAMPDSIPADTRKASLRGAFRCKMTEKYAKALEEDTGVPAEQILAGKIEDESWREQIEESPPYFNTKFVLVEEGGALKVGYFEFMPRSMFD